jgi:hypothetical protein
MWVVGLAMAFGMASFCGLTHAQNTGDQADGVGVVRGTVLNSVTKTPVVRALVVTDEYATFTDDQGRFEFQIRQLEQPDSGPQQFIGLSFTVRRPGYLNSRHPATVVVSSNGAKNEAKDITVYAVPEARVVGHVEVPGSEGDVRIECELYRRHFEQGIEKWLPSGTFSTWATGEFRFSNLKAGSYKLITHEQMERDSMVPVPGRPLFGYPPMYYPNATDFSAAAPIVVKAGETAEVNLTVARRGYYPVRIGVVNGPGDGRIGVTVYPMGHHSPGWSLGYNQMDQSVEGMLPDGNYTVELHSFEQNASAGMLNFAVRGRPLVEGAAVTMVPIAAIAVNVHEEFQSNANGTGNGMAYSGPGQPGAGLQVRLTSLEEVGNPGDHFDYFAEAVPGSQDHAQVLKGVRPGRYKIHVTSEKGYAAAIDYGGVDLLKQSLVVGPGGGNTAIEITLRNDGAEVDGTVQGTAPSEEGALPNNGAPPRYIFLLSLEDAATRMWMEPTWSNFQFTQIPPGDYLVVAFEEDQTDLDDAEKLQALESKGQVIHLEAGQKVSVNVKAIAESDSQ